MNFLRRIGNLFLPGLGCCYYLYIKFETLSIYNISSLQLFFLVVPKIVQCNHKLIIKCIAGTKNNRRKLLVPKWEKILFIFTCWYPSTSIHDIPNIMPFVLTDT
jgi:hypothetical protein